MIASPHARARDDRGIAAIWMAIFLVVLLSCAALAVDLGYRHVVAQRAQDAADASALGGTVFLPTDFSQASARARELAVANGFDPNDPNVSISTSAVVGQPTQLKVTIRRTVPAFFGGIVGVKNMTVTKTAIADYDQPVQMGNPSNTFGNQPDCVDACTSGDPSPEFWANLQGPGTGKSKGNAFTSNTCDSASDGCAGGTNSDYQPEGLLYTVRNTNAGGTLRIDLFDAIYAHVGDTCNDPSLVNLHNFFAGFPAFAARYQPGGWSAANQYCTGDESTAYPLAQDSPTRSIFRVYAPDDTPWTIADNTLVPGCSLAVDGSNDVYGDFNRIQQWFRQWSTLCTIFGAQSGDYVLQVQAPAGTGNNNFSVRVSNGGDLTSRAVSVFGQGRMGIYANSAGAANTNFYLARILPGAAGRNLNLEFFDTGDALADAVGTLQVLPPVDATDGGSILNTFSQCQFTPPPGTSFTSTSSSCAVSGVSAATYQGQWVRWRIPIPQGYSCDLNDPFGCWVRINFRFNGGVQDVTSWRASLDGNPVRIIS